MLEKMFLLNYRATRDYKTYELNLNMSRARIFTSVIFFLEIFMLLLTFVKPSLFSSEDLFSYRFHYVILLLLVIFIQICAWIYEKKIKTYKKEFSAIVVIAVIFSLLWGVSITYLDIRNGGSISVYMTFLFMLSSVVIMHPLKAFLSLLIGHVALLILISNEASFIEFGINGSIFLIFAWFVTRQQYLFIFNRFKVDALIKEKNQILEIQNKELVRLTMVDHLTGMYNRYSLDEILSKKTLEAYINKSPLTLMMIDIDNFKQINDAYGHIFGDTCLVYIADLLNKFVKSYQGYGFRYGGDEFCLIFDEDQPATILLDQLNKLTDHMVIASENGQIKLSLTIGMTSQIPKTSKDSWQLIDMADEALYHMKSKKKRRKTD